MPEYRGLLLIGDPHLASRVPGFRKDDYPRVTLGKLAWCLDYARDHRLLPALLGDLFDIPRDNANWLLGELLALFARQEILGIYGNHDCHEDALGPDDSLTVLLQAGSLRLLTEAHPWRGTIAGRPIVVGGTSYSPRIPREFPRPPGGLVIWLTHFDWKVEGYDAGKIDPRPIPGIDLVVNGHIHRHLPDVVRGQTTWLTPGNIARVKRGDMSQAHIPGALEILIDPAAENGWRHARIPVPHQPYDQVFHPLVIEPDAATDTAGGFVRGLKEFLAHRTATGENLALFLKANEETFDPPVREQIWQLYKEIANDGDAKTTRDPTLAGS